MMDYLETSGKLTAEVSGRFPNIYINKKIWKPAKNFRCRFIQIIRKFCACHQFFSLTGQEQI
jgi:hypothetical protein